MATSRLTELTQYRQPTDCLLTLSLQRSQATTTPLPGRVLWARFCGGVGLYGSVRVDARSADGERRLGRAVKKKLLNDILLPS